MNPIHKLIGEAEDLWSSDQFELDAALGELKIKTPKDAYHEAERLGKGNVYEALERLIAKQATYAYYYAMYCLEAPFPLGENVIAKSAGFSYLYARDVLKARFHLGEEAVRDSVYWPAYKAHFKIK